MGAKYTRGSPELLVVGSASRDLASDDRRGWRLGGGVTYGALTSARLGVRTAAIIGVDAAAARATELDLLRIAGVDLELVELPSIPVFENIETADGRVQRCLEPGVPLSPEAMRESLDPTEAWLLAPVAGELVDEWATLPRPGAVVGVGWQGLLRTLAAGQVVQRRAPRPSLLLERADVVGVSVDDLDRATALEDLLALLRYDATLLLTRGAGGGAAIGRRASGKLVRRSYPAIAAERTADPTGAGDAFLAAFLTTRLSASVTAARRGADLQFAAAVASLVVERPGLLGVPEHDAVARRLAKRGRGPSGDDPAA